MLTAMLLHLQVQRSRALEPKCFWLQTGRWYSLRTCAALLLAAAHSSLLSHGADHVLNGLGPSNGLREHLWCKEGMCRGLMGHALSWHAQRARL